MDRTSRIVVGAVVAVVVVVAAALLVRARSEPDGPALQESIAQVPGSSPATTPSTGDTAVPESTAPESTVPDSTSPSPSSSRPANGAVPGARPTAPSTAAPGGPGGVSPASSSKGRLASVATWSFALGADLGDATLAPRLAGYDLVVIDGADATPAVVGALHRQGAVVLGYVSVGTVERNRSWSNAATPYLLDHWGEWDETYADTNQAGYRDLIANTVAPPILDKGFDGLFLDNTDMVDSHPAQGPGMIELVRRLSETVHGRGGVLFAQNGDTTVDGIAPYLDGWNREDLSSTYDFDTQTYSPRSAAEQQAGVATIARMRGRGLLVTAVDYTADGAGPVVDGARQTACSAGAVPYVSDIGLSRIPASPPRC